MRSIRGRRPDAERGTEDVSPVSVRAASPRLLHLARPHLGRLVLAAGCMVISTLSFLGIPYAFRLVTDSVFLHHSASQLNRVTLLLFVIVISTAVFGYGRGYLLQYVGARVVADLRLRLYRHLLNQPLSFFDNRRSGDLLSRLSSDTTLVQNVLSDDLLTLFQNIITVVGVVVVVLVLDWRLAVITLAVAPLVAAMGLLVGRRTRRLSQQAQEELGGDLLFLSTGGRRRGASLRDSRHAAHHSGYPRSAIPPASKGARGAARCLVSVRGRGSLRA